MGEVYRATDTRLGREVALKVLPADMAADHDRLTRFHREARAAAALNHPNIVTLYSAEEIDGIHFFTMELVDGRPLDELIPAEGFPADRVVELAAPLAEAIAAAHDVGASGLVTLGGESRRIAALSSACDAPPNGRWPVSISNGDRRRRHDTETVQPPPRNRDRVGPLYRWVRPPAGSRCPATRKPAAELTGGARLPAWPGTGRSARSVNAHEYGHGFNAGPQPLERALAAASRAVDLAPGNPLARQAMSTVLLFRKEITASLHEADRAIALNPFDAGCQANMGANIAFAGDWIRGCALIKRSMDLNPQHPVWYRGMLSVREYWSGNYRGAIDEAVKTNAPYLFWLQIVLAAAHGQLGEQQAASAASRALMTLVPSFSANPRAILNTWLQPDLVEHLIQGLQKAGMSIAASASGPR